MNIIKKQDLDITTIVSSLKNGETLVYPTETCYGLGCDATNEGAVNKVFEIKSRQKNKALLVVAADISMMMKYVIWNETLQRIADRYWPGALTVVAKSAQDSLLPAGVVAEDDTIAFRITNHHLAAEISKSLGGPLVSTSANVAELESPYDISAVVQMFQNNEHQPDTIIDAGELPHHSASTIVRVSDNKIEVLRQGEVVVEL